MTVARKIVTWAALVVVAGVVLYQTTELDTEQRKFLTEMTENIKTKNSVADINRLKDSLVRWDELFANNTNMFPGKMQAVIPIIKQRVIERVAELETEAAKNGSGRTR